MIQRLSKKLYYSEAHTNEIVDKVNEVIYVVNFLIDHLSGPDHMELLRHLEHKPWQEK